MPNCDAPGCIEPCIPIVCMVSCCIKCVFYPLVLFSMYSPQNGDSISVPLSSNTASLTWTLPTHLNYLELQSLTIGDPSISNAVQEFTMIATTSKRFVLNVTGTITIRAMTWTINHSSSAISFWIVGRFVNWVGQTVRAINRPTFSLTVSRPDASRIEATEGIVISTGNVAYPTKEIQNLVVVASQSGAVHADVHSITLSSGAQLSVSTNTVMEIFSPLIMTSNVLTPPQTDIINNGVIRFACLDICNMNSSVTNHNRLEFVPQRLATNQSTLPSWLWSGTLTNNALIVSYFTHIKLIVSGTQVQAGSLSVFAASAVSQTYTYTSAGAVSWWTTLAAMAANSSSYNFHERVTFSVDAADNEQKAVDVAFIRFLSQGPVSFEILPVTETKISVTTAVCMDHHGKLHLKTSNLTRNTLRSFTLGWTTTLVTGYLFVGEYWAFEVGASTLIQRQCVVAPGAEIRTKFSGLAMPSASYQPFLTFASQLYLKQRSIANPSLAIEANLAVRVKDLFIDCTDSTGLQLNAINATFEVSGRTAWYGGDIRGNGQNVVLRGGGTVSENRSKTLSNVNLVVEGNSTELLRGCVVEYFQFRSIASANNPTVLSITGFYSAGNGSSQSRLPQSFDDPLSQADYSTFEKSCSEEAQAFGNAPVVFNSNGGIAENYLLSFTHNYAMRMTTRVDVPNDGNCTFSFSWSYGILRLWLDHQAVAILCGNGSATSDNRTACTSDALPDVYNQTTVQMSAGQHDVRIDIIRLLPSAGHADYAYKIIPTMTCTGAPASSITVGDSSMIRGCQTARSTFYPRTSFVIRYPENVCESGSSTTDLCNIKHGVSCLKVSDSVVLNMGATVRINPTGVLWVNGSGNISEGTQRVRGALGMVSSGLVTESNGGKVMVASSQQSVGNTLNCTSDNDTSILNVAGR